MKIKQVSVAFKAGPEDGLNEGEFIVYPSTFTKTPDSYGDVVAPGAFADDIAARKADGDVLPGLFGHRMDDPDFFVAYALDEGEDDHGWWVKGAFDLDSAKGKQVYRLVKGRRINQLSFAYDVIDEGSVELDGGVKANELRKLKTYEFSFVPIGANQDTSVVAVKDATAALANLHAKAGRVLSSKNEDALRTARDHIDSVLKALDGSTEDDAATGGTDQGKASGPTNAKTDASDEAASGGKSPVSAEEQKSRSSADSYLAVISIYERN
jgi:HK97 family phage prohead protease